MTYYQAFCLRVVCVVSACVASSGLCYQTSGGGPSGGGGNPPPPAIAHWDVTLSSTTGNTIETVVDHIQNTTTTFTRPSTTWSTGVAYDTTVTLQGSVTRRFLVEWVDAQGRRGFAADRTDMPKDVFLLVSNSASAKVPTEDISSGSSWTGLSQSVDDGFSDEPVDSTNRVLNVVYRTRDSSGKHLVRHAGEPSFTYETTVTGSVSASAIYPPLSALMTLALLSDVSIDSRGVLIDHDARDAQGNNYRPSEPDPEQETRVMYGVTIPYASQEPNIRTGYHDYLRIDLGLGIVNYVNPPTLEAPLGELALTRLQLTPTVINPNSPTRPVSYQWVCDAVLSTGFTAIGDDGEPVGLSGALPSDNVSYVPFTKMCWFQDSLVNGDIHSEASLDDTTVTLRVTWDDGAVAEDKVKIVLHHKTEEASAYITQMLKNVNYPGCLQSLENLYGIAGDSLTIRAGWGAIHTSSEYHLAQFATYNPQLVDADGWAYMSAPCSVPGVYDSFHDWNSVLVNGLSDTLDMADVVPGVGWFLKLSGKLLKLVSDPDLSIDFEVPDNEKFAAWWYRTHWDQPDFADVPTDLNGACLRTSCKWRAGYYKELDLVHSHCWMFGPFGFELQDNDSKIQKPSQRGDRFYIFKPLDGVEL